MQMQVKKAATVALISDKGDVRERVSPGTKKPFHKDSSRGHNNSKQSCT